jgi:hypothetical protein
VAGEEARGQTFELGPQHALIRGLREGSSETELTRALAAVLDAEREMAAEFVRLAVREAPHGGRVDLADLPTMLGCTAEEKVAKGRADLTFTDDEHCWHVIVEIKIHAGYGHDQIGRYLRSFRRSAERSLLIAITRDVPTYGDYEADDPSWAGSVQWARLLPGMRALMPRNPMLAQQWPLFLDVLEKEGSMGFTQPDTDLFRSWAKYRRARDHMIDFVDSLRRPLLEAFRDALQQDSPSVPRTDLADFSSRGTKTPRVVVPTLGKVGIGFKIPSSGPERVWAGMHHGQGEPLFAIEFRVPQTPASAGPAATLTAAGFWTWKDWMGTQLKLPDELLLSPQLQQTVIEFSGARFQKIASSRVLELEPVAAPDPRADDNAEEGPDDGA